ncbi:hypothetical protein COLO4_25157 [Corchorus olitorius]|uniref:Uncharacterized protein n=1 Tax=Corchorus olitorius TaxID=93759 RepID=A0A1R3I4D4_9ROSI|nr:hypothetical protein COLO4_25157 [Corchorus olitorius]
MNCSATFSASKSGATTGSANASALKQQKVPLRAAEPTGVRVDAATPPPRPASNKTKPPRAKGSLSKCAGRVWFDDENNVISSTETGIRTSPRSRAKMSAARTSSSQTVSSNSIGGRQVIGRVPARGQKRKTMGGIGVYTNLKTGRQIENPGRPGQTVLNIGTSTRRRAIDTNDPTGTQESNCTSATMATGPSKATAEGKGKQKARWK